MSYASIRSAIETTLQGIPSIGTIFGHSLVTESPSLFDTVDNVWTVSLNQRRVREKSNEIIEARYEIHIDGFRPVGSGGTTETTFNDLAISIQNAFADDISLNGLCLQHRPDFLDHEDPNRDDQGADLFFSRTTFASSDCFKAQITLKVAAHEDRIFNDQFDDFLTSQITWADTIEDTVTHEQ